ncbi:MAG: PQQ-binding-like beta-propeller repeat protein [Planctomycetaceae bacterium]|nr:PQQ-binding-like beta-propeller repeat protein [Planctomycetaceae bacterium]
MSSVAPVLRQFAVVFVLSGPIAFGAESKTSVLLPLNGTEQVTATYEQKDAQRFLENASDKADTVDGNGALHFGGTSPTRKGSKYFGVRLALPAPIDLTKHSVLFHARTNQPGTTAALYVRAYNRGEKEPALSYNSWDAQLTQAWREFRLQPGLSMTGLAWEKSVVADRTPAAVDRFEFIIGTRENNVPVDMLLDNVRIAPRLISLQELQSVHPSNPDTPLVADGKAVVTILHPDTEAGRRAAAAVAASIADRTGAAPAVRAAAEADRMPGGPAILLGNVDNNPAMLLLYARYMTPADSICPGAGGALVHTICDPFGRGANVVVAGATDDAGLDRAAEVLSGVIRRQDKAALLTLPRLFERHYGESFLKRFAWADDEPAANRLERGLQDGQKALDEGRHCSVASVLSSVANRYRFTGHSVEAELFVKLWDLYAESAVADPRKYGGPWGFDSDFPSLQVVTGWDLIEDDPALSGDDRLRTTKNMGRWLTEAVVPKCAGAATSTHVPHNHQTFPGLGALAAGLYLTAHYDTVEGRVWLDIADRMFTRQTGYFKPYEDCNGYQWLTNGHLMRYCVARPDFTLFENGNGARIVDYCIGTMNNLGYQVPYGDTGSWQCWNSEMVCLDTFAFATGSAEARWVANLKRSVKNTAETHAFYQLAPAERPDAFDGVRVWPVEPQYYATHGAENRPPVERCFDKIAFRESLDRAAAYLLLDGLSNGGHKHLDGNSLPQLTLFDRIWLADNDYFKAPVKFHNSVAVFRDGQSKAIPPYAELLGAGQSERFGYSKTRLEDYAGADWVRTVVWLKELQAFVVLDQLTARSDQEYQFRTLWHGVGEATLDEYGLLLTQKGPSLRIDVAPGPQLDLQADTDLGANWKGYPRADPVVQSLQAVATVKLKQGETYLFASVLHGKADGTTQPWKIDFLADSPGIKLAAGEKTFGIALGPYDGDTVEGYFKTDAECIVISDAALSFLGITRAAIAGVDLYKADDVSHVDLPIPEAAGWLARAPLCKPVANLSAAADAPAHQVRWSAQLGSDSSKPLHVTRLAGASSGGTRQPDTILVATAEGTLFALAPDGSTRWTVDAGSQLNDVTAADLTGDGKDEIVLARQDHLVQVLDASGQELWKKTLEYYRRPPYVNLVRTGDIDGDGTPEVIAGGENWRFYAFEADGTELWNYESVHPSRAGAVVDLDGDGKAEVLCGTHYYWATALNADGTARWKCSFGPICYDIATGRFDQSRRRGVVFGSGDGKVHLVDSAGKMQMEYDTGDEVKHVAAGDLDGDGVDEVLAGSLNYNVYCFGADKQRRWRLDLGAPVSALAIVPQKPGDLAIAGTAQGRLATIDAKGNIRAVSQLNSEVRDILVCPDSVVVAAADGRVTSLIP